MSINKEQATLIRRLFHVIQKPHLLMIRFTALSVTTSFKDNSSDLRSLLENKILNV